jgi:hypothetical protein
MRTRYVIFVVSLLAGAWCIAWAIKAPPTEDVQQVHRGNLGAGSEAKEDRAAKGVAIRASQIPDREKGGKLLRLVTKGMSAYEVEAIMGISETRWEMEGYGGLTYRYSSYGVTVYFSGWQATSVIYDAPPGSIDLLFDRIISFFFFVADFGQVLGG